MPDEHQLLCPHCKTPMGMELTGRPRQRTFKCKYCSTTDPMRCSDTKRWLDGELGQKTNQNE